MGIIGVSSLCFGLAQGPLRSARSCRGGLEGMRRRPRRCLAIAPPCHRWQGEGSQGRPAKCRMRGAAHALPVTVLRARRGATTRGRMREAAGPGPGPGRGRPVRPAGRTAGPWTTIAIRQRMWRVRRRMCQADAAAQPRERSGEAKGPGSEAFADEAIPPARCCERWSSPGAQGLRVKEDGRCGPIRAAARSASRRRLVRARGNRCGPTPQFARTCGRPGPALASALC